MNLHKNIELFRNYISLVSQEEDIDEAIVLKDYFVVLALKKLYQHNDNHIFIGGTSLSKCFGIINRFSEDIDLVSISDSRKGKQRETYEAIQTLKVIWEGIVEENNEKYTDFKEMYLHYPTSKKTDLDQRVKIELITFMEPFPIISKAIETMIYPYLDEFEIIKYEMEPVVVKTQEPYRTMMEKILLEKELYKDFKIGNQLNESIEKRARDFYDIHKIWNYYNKKLPFDYLELKHMIESRIKNRRRRTSISEEKFVFFKLDEIFIEKNIARQLNEIDKRKLSIRDLDTNAIKKSMKEVDEAIIRIINNL